ncbi:hypothetical protein IQ265_19345 [Nodosilinea sp. LEGE 06152]|nr:hypothetical protein [Nodosilinea sp. LEGE 06152]
MTTREQLLLEISNAPDFLLEEVLDFLLFAKMRRQQPADLIEVDTVADQAIDQSQTPIWEAFEEFADTLPKATAAALPTDGAAQLDHYLYGSPKSDP